jgi:uncharacterized membrane protein YhhN
MSKKNVSLLLLIIGLLSAIAFIVFRHTLPLYITLVLKVIPTLMMCCWIIYVNLDKDNALVFVGLIFSMTGDVFMELNGDAFLIIGIIANTLGIICYTLYFYFSDRSLDIIRLIPVAIVMGVFYIILYNYLGDLKLPVLVYCIIHTLFLWRSSARFGDIYINPVSQYICFIGCVSVSISDFLLSLTIFNVLPTIPLYEIVDMILWWSGLLMITITAEIRRQSIKKRGRIPV